MAKIRHRTFEIFDFLQESSDALASKSVPANTHKLDPDLWTFQHIDARLRPTGVVHVTFKPHKGSESESMNKLDADLTVLAESLANDSRVLFDFEGLPAFNSEAIAKLGDFDTKLRNKGSRVVLCNLESAVRASFFPNP